MIKSTVAKRSKYNSQRLTRKGIVRLPDALIGQVVFVLSRKEYYNLLDVNRKYNHIRRVLKCL